MYRIELNQEQKDELEQLLLDITYKSKSPDDITWGKYNMNVLFDVCMMVEDAQDLYNRDRPSTVGEA